MLPHKISHRTCCVTPSPCPPAPWRCAPLASPSRASYTTVSPAHAAERRATYPSYHSGKLKTLVACKVAAPFAAVAAAAASSSSPPWFAICMIALPIFALCFSFYTSYLCATKWSSWDYIVTHQLKLVKRKAAASAATAGRPAVPAASGTFQQGTFYLDMDVRDYELDHYGVVHSGIYAHYFQHARHEALKLLLACSPEQWAEQDNPLSLSRLNIQYSAPLRSQDKFQVAVSVSKVTSERVLVHHTIVRTATRGKELEQPQEVASAVGTIVFLDSQLRPSKIPAGLKEVFIEVHQQQQEQQQQQQEQQ